MQPCSFGILIVAMLSTLRSDVHSRIPAGVAEPEFEATMSCLAERRKASAEQEAARLMTQVAKIVNTSAADRVFAFEILAAYWCVRSDPSKNEAKAIRVSSRPDQVWRASEKTEPGQKGNLKNLCKGVRDLLLATPVDTAWTQADRALLSASTDAAIGPKQRRILAACSVHAAALAVPNEETAATTMHGLPALLAAALHEYHAAPRRQRMKWTEAEDAALFGCGTSVIPIRQMRAR